MIATHLLLPTGNQERREIDRHAGQNITPDYRNPEWIEYIKDWLQHP